MLPLFLPCPQDTFLALKYATFPSSMGSLIENSLPVKQSPGWSDMVGTPDCSACSPYRQNGKYDGDTAAPMVFLLAAMFTW